MLSKIFTLRNFVWFCAIGLASFSGYYSVFGISKLFSGGSLSIVGMAAMLELSKLVVVTFIHNHFKSLRLLFKSYLIAAAVVLMGITSIGVYGYLTNSYQETAKTINKTQNELTLLDQTKRIFEDQKVQIDKLISDKTDRIKSYDNIRTSQENTYNTSVQGKKVVRGLQKNIQSIDKSTQTLNNDISALTVKSLALSDSASMIEQRKLTLSNETLTSELGPLLYLSKITNLPMDIVVNWFILILVAVFDPLAVSLVIAANHLKKIDGGNSEINLPIPPLIKEESVIKPEFEELPIIPEIKQEEVTIEPVENNFEIPENNSILKSSDFDEQDEFYHGNKDTIRRYTRGIST